MVDVGNRETIPAQIQVKKKEKHKLVTSFRFTKRNFQNLEKVQNERPLNAKFL